MGQLYRKDLDKSNEDDKRFIATSHRFTVTHTPEQKKHYCKYCYKKTNTTILYEFDVVLSEGQELRYCNQCGSGLEILP